MINKPSKQPCCGAKLEREDISTFGLVTLSVPLYYILALIIFIAKFVKKMEIERVAIIHSANGKLINNHEMFPEIRNKLTAILLKYFPLLARPFFFLFNLLILSIPWLLVITLGVWR